MRTTLAVILVSLALTPPAHAEMLLMEISHEQVWSTDNTCSVRGDATRGCTVLGITAGPGRFVRHNLTPADIGQTVALEDADELATFDAELRNPAAWVQIWTGGQGGNITPVFNPDALWSPATIQEQLQSGTFTVTPHVPRLGAGLAGYQLTNITQTLDSLVIIDWYEVIPAQTIRLYGQLVPPTPTTIPGDYNGDGTVDAADYVVWRRAMSVPLDERPDLPNAISGPRPASDADWIVWRAMFGNTQGALQAAAVPEPASWLLVMCGGAVIHCRRKR